MALPMCEKHGRAMYVGVNPHRTVATQEQKKARKANTSAQGKPAPSRAARGQLINGQLYTRNHQNKDYLPNCTLTKIPMLPMANFVTIPMFTILVINYNYN